MRAKEGYETEESAIGSDQIRKLSNRGEPAGTRPQGLRLKSHNGLSGSRPATAVAVAIRNRRTQFDAEQAYAAQKDSRYLFTGSTPLIDHSLFRFFAAFDTGFTLVQFPGAVLTTEIPAAAAARHEGHLDSVFGFTLITLAGTAGFGHRSVSTTGCLSSQDVMSMIWRLLQEVAHIRHIVRSTLKTYRCSSLHRVKSDKRWSRTSQSHRHCRTASQSCGRLMKSWLDHF